MSTEASSSTLRSQEIDRTRARRRRANAVEGDGYKRVTVRLTASELATVREAADEAGMSVPQYLAQCALNPVGASVTKSGKARPWLTWPKRLALQRLLLSASSALHVLRLEQVAPVGSNLNQIARIANSTGYLDPERGEELDIALEEWRALDADMRERGARMEQLAKDVTRR
ncbi:plasmid mobilization protein [Nocardia salmonicida]|uniref:plasmid mobilization protein n=1 Tax=Nocardia salmonicida TaxID=53431 RepID=UPI00378A4AEF